MADVGPPIALIAVGLILWLAVTATIGGISIQTIGLILFVIGVVWLVIELAVDPSAAHRRDARARGRPPGRPRARSALASRRGTASKGPSGQMSGRPLLVPEPWGRDLDGCPSPPRVEAADGLSRRPPGKESRRRGFTEGTQQMGNATRGAGVGNRGGIRFGIRWDDGRRPKRLLLPLVAVCAALAPVGGRRGAPRPGARPGRRRRGRRARPRGRRRAADGARSAARSATPWRSSTASRPRCRAARSRASSAPAPCARSAATARSDSQTTPAPTRPRAPPRCCARATGADCLRVRRRGRRRRAAGLRHRRARRPRPARLAGARPRLLLRGRRPRPRRPRHLRPRHAPRRRDRRSRPAQRLRGHRARRARGERQGRGRRRRDQPRAGPGRHELGARAPRPARTSACSTSRSARTDEADYRRDVLAWAAEQLWKDGIAVVASAGNEGAARACSTCRRPTRT